MSNLHPLFDNILKPYDYDRADCAIDAVERVKIDWPTYDHATAAGKREDESHLEFALRCMSEAQK